MTAKTLNITKLTDDKSFAADAASIAKRGEAVQMDIHRHLYAIAFRWNETGDIRPAVKRVNDLLTVLPKGLRLNAIREWVEVMFGFEYVEKSKDAPEHFKAGAIKGADLPMDTILHKRWYEFKAEAAYKPINFGESLQKLLKQAGQRVNSAKGDEVDAEMLAAVQAAVAGLTAKRAEEAKLASGSVRA
jgi:hypothetical protein